MRAKSKPPARSQLLEAEELREKLRDIDSRAVGAAPAPKRRHLEGLAYYFVYVPALIVASICVFLFIDFTERWLYDEED